MILFTEFARSLFGTRSAPEGESPLLSRRQVLAGLGAVAGLAAAGSLLLPVGSAEAAAPLQSFPDDALDGEVLGDLDTESLDGSEEPQLAQSYRYRRRALLRRCRRDRYFRRRNRRLCRRAEGSVGRPGACVQIGPVTICE